MLNEILGESKKLGETNDCVVIALSISCNIPYSIAHEYCKQKGRKSRKGFNCFDPLSGDDSSLFWEYRISNITVGDKNFTIYYHVKPHMTIKTFSKRFSKGRYVVVRRRHALSVIDGNVINERSSLNQHVNYFFEIVEIPQSSGEEVIY